MLLKLVVVVVVVAPPIMCSSSSIWFLQAVDYFNQYRFDVHYICQT